MCLLLVFGVCVGATGEGPLALRVAWETLWQAPEAVRVPIEEQQATRTVEIPALAVKEGQALCLRFQARMHFASPAGWNDYLALAWNGKPVGAMTAAGRWRVVNRHPVFTTEHPNYPEEPLFKNRDGLSCLQVFFGPPGDLVDKSITTDQGEGYWYLIDISDMASGEANQLTVTNTALKRFWNNAVPEDTALVLESFAVGAVPREALLQLQSERLEKRELLAGTALPGSGPKVSAVPGGGLQLEAGNEVYFVESAFSFPRDGGMGFNRLQCLPAAEGESDWQPQVSANGDGITVKAEGATYRLERQVTRAKHRIEVADALTNKTDAILGVSIKHRIITPGEPRRTFLGGLNTMVMASGRSAENPTVFLCQATTGLGAVAEDNALRLQLWRRAVNNAVDFGTERLGLAPGESYILTWVLYPGSTDYFDFINQVRRDWNVNFTVDGPYDFFDTRQVQTLEGREQAKQLLARRRLKLFSLTPWFEYYNGWGVSRDEYRKLMTEAQAFIKSVVPDAKCIA